MGYVIAALGLGFMIAVHEFGHFIAAKLSGMVVTEYSLGMGPVLWKHTWGETQYSLRMFPVGGYVSVWGEDSPESKDKNGKFSYDPARHYERFSRWKRAGFIAAGPAMNIVTALVVSLVLSMQAEGCVKAVVVAAEGSAALHWSQSEMVTEKTDLEILDSRLQPGDRIKAVNGYPLLCLQDMVYFVLSPTGSVELSIDRNGKSQKIEDVQLEHLYVDLQIEENSGVHKLETAARMTVSDVVMTYASLKMLITGAIPVTTVTGPIGAVAAIGSTMESSAGLDFADALLLFAVVSANLGVMNLLPIPALDGGHLMFLGIECLINRPVPRTAQRIAQEVMLTLLMVVMALIAGMDIYGLFTGKFK